MALLDPQGNRIQLKSEQFPPKLRRNRKLEFKWGNEYYEAVNKAVFSNEYAPYMPSEPPASIKEEIDKTGYVCKQCRDCFRFLSSIEAHTSRRSWILGYWCQGCFPTKCTHVPKGEPMCRKCTNIEASKHAYLAEKGIRRNMKKAVTRVFYNQCQFFAHLRMHGTSVVDLSEVMLMPLPSEIKEEDYPSLDRLFKALMETMFIRRVHIMDWLTAVKIPLNSWETPLELMKSKEKSPVAYILSRYYEDCLNPKDLEIRSRRDKPIQRVDPRKVSTNNVSQTCDEEEKDPLGDESSNDIAFVDCGPTPSHAMLSEFPSVLAVKDSSKHQPIDRANSLWRSFSQQYDKFKDKPRELKSVANEERKESSPPLKLQLQSPRVVAIHNPQNVNLSTIMRHLPIQGVVTTKKFVVVADGKEGEISQSPTSDKKEVVQLKPKEKKSSEISVNNKPKTPAKITTSTSNSTNQVGKPLLMKSQSFSEQMSLHGRVVFQNGRKYIIKHVAKKKSQSMLPESVIVKKVRKNFPILPATGKNPILLKPVQGIPVAGKPSILPKPAAQGTTKIPITGRTSILSQSPLQRTPRIASVTSLNTQRHVQLGRPPRRIRGPVLPSEFSLSTMKANITTQNSKGRVTKIQKSLMIKCRETMMADLHRATKKELDSYIKHLKEINDIYVKTVSSETDCVVTNNLKTIECFENIQPSGTIRDSTNEKSNIQDAFDITTSEWEKRIKPTDKLRTCDTCSKVVKPPTYVIGMSGPAVDETTFCQCYNNVCYICNANQGSLIQLKAHIKWHKGEKPYMCPSCSIIFPSAMDLEIHVWTTCFHPMARYVYGCGVCEMEGIVDMESIAKHFLLLHTRRKVICAECKMEYTGKAPTYSDYAKHFAQHHPDVETISEPKRLFVCNLKQCIIRPELFRAHLSDHIGVLKWIYYKCPFCPTITQGSGRNKSLMREHLIRNHLDRMHEIVNPESLSKVLDGIKLIRASVTPVKLGEITNATTTGPLILNARTITPATFEQTSESFDNQFDETPEILEVRSEASKEIEDSTIDDLDLEILTVKSASDRTLDSPAMGSEGSNTMQLDPSGDFTVLNDTPEVLNINSLGSIDNSEIDISSSNSHHEISLVSINSDSKLMSEFEKEFSYEPQEFNKEYLAPHLKALLLQDMSQRRPWRIALNNPTNVEVEPVAYNCHLCGELINTSWPVIKNHFDSYHSNDYEIFQVAPKIPRISMDFIEGGYKNESDSKKRKSETTMPSVVPKRRKRWGPKKHFERSTSPSYGICVKPQPVEEIEGNFRCKKCDELFKDIAMMREHIAIKHRIKGQYLICLECGENFVVSPSLQMHLKALHGIQDPITYLSKNTAYAPETLDDMEEEEKATESNQCYVCMAVFENKPSLDKHMRVHGMAFLKRKRFEAQKALKGSIKTNANSDRQPEVENLDEKSSNARKESKDESPDSSNSAGNANQSSNNRSEDDKSTEEINKTLSTTL